MARAMHVTVASHMRSAGSAEGRAETKHGLDGNDGLDGGGDGNGEVVAWLQDCLAWEWDQWRVVTAAAAAATAGGERTDDNGAVSEEAPLPRPLSLELLYVTLPSRSQTSAPSKDPAGGSEASSVEVGLDGQLDGRQVKEKGPATGDPAEAAHVAAEKD